jgi:hypothetical protein
MFRYDPRYDPISLSFLPFLTSTKPRCAARGRSTLKVDFWLAQPEPFEEEMLRRRVRTTLFGEPAWISTAEDIVLHKLIWNRLSPSERQAGDGT